MSYLILANEKKPDLLNLGNKIALSYILMTTMSDLQGNTGDNASSPWKPAAGFTHVGDRYILGFGDDFFAIYDKLERRDTPTEPVQSFPRTQDGWVQAWKLFVSWEPKSQELLSTRARRPRPETAINITGRSATSFSGSIPKSNLQPSSPLKGGRTAFLVNSAQGSVRSSVFKKPNGSKNVDLRSDQIRSNFSALEGRKINTFRMPKGNFLKKLFSLNKQKPYQSFKTPFVIKANTDFSAANPYLNKSASHQSNAQNVKPALAPLPLTQPNRFSRYNVPETIKIQATKNTSSKPNHPSQETQNPFGFKRLKPKVSMPSHFNQLWIKIGAVAIVLIIGAIAIFASTSNDPTASFLAKARPLCNQLFSQDVNQLKLVDTSNESPTSVISALNARSALETNTFNQLQQIAPSNNQALSQIFSQVSQAELQQRELALGIYQNNSISVLNLSQTLSSTDQTLNSELSSIGLGSCVLSPIGS